MKPKQTLLITQNFEIWKILFEAKETLAIYNLGRRRLNLFSGDVPSGLADLLRKGVRVELFTQMPKSPQFDGFMGKYGLSRIAVHHVSGAEVPMRLICIADSKRYVCDLPATEETIAQVQTLYPFCDRNFAEEFVEDLCDIGYEEDWIGVFESYMEAARRLSE